MAGWISNTFPFGLSFDQSPMSALPWVSSSPHHGMLVFHLEMFILPGLWLPLSASDYVVCMSFQTRPVIMWWLMVLALLRWVQDSLVHAFQLVVYYTISTFSLLFHRQKSFCIWNQRRIFQKHNESVQPLLHITSEMSGQKIEQNS